MVTGAPPETARSECAGHPSSALGSSRRHGGRTYCIVCAAWLLEYLGLGATVALTPGGAIVIQADHTTEALRLEDLALAA
jgi:hypothetical protein